MSDPVSQAAPIDASISVPARSVRPMRVCLAGSGGGHIRQLQDLEPAWAPYDVFFVSTDTALSRSIAASRDTDFVAHFALGQARLGMPLKMIVAAIRNFCQSTVSMLRRRPHVLITTGAGSMFFCVVWARLLGARIVVVESFARFDNPSLFARWAFPLAHRRVVQSRTLAAQWPDAAVFDPLRMLDSDRPAKQPLLVGVVGLTLTFDRLVEMIVSAKIRGDIPERVLIQVGIGGRAERGDLPAGVEIVETLPFARMTQLLRDADIVVCHGGTGAIITALRQGCRVVAVPRRYERGEHYDDHQVELTGAFAARGLVTVANSNEELTAALISAREALPTMATTDPVALVAHLGELLSEWGVRKAR